MERFRNRLGFSRENSGNSGVFAKFSLEKNSEPMLSLCQANLKKVRKRKESKRLCLKQRWRRRMPARSAYQKIVYCTELQATQVGFPLFAKTAAALVHKTGCYFRLNLPAMCSVYRDCSVVRSYVVSFLRENSAPASVHKTGCYFRLILPSMRFWYRICYEVRWFAK